MTKEETIPDPFEGYEPLEGLEHLGRHIVDAQGQPSGSPANFENVRGTGNEPLNKTAYKDVLSALKKEFGDK
jgi:hypothetical protein